MARLHPPSYCFIRQPLISLPSLERLFHGQIRDRVYGCLPGVPAATVLFAEALYTFALALVILNVATSPRTEGNSYYGLAIGFTVMTGAFAVGGISGGVFNPAVGTGPILAALAGEGSAGSLWLYWVGPVAGAALAVPVYRMQHGNGD